MAETNINIYLKTIDDSNETNPQDPGTTPEADNPIENKGEQGKGIKASAVVAGMYMAKQALAFAESSVGYATRDTLKQQQMNSFNKAVIYGGLLVKSPLMGLAVITADAIKTDIERNRNMRQEQISINIARERMGNMNRSR